MILLSALSLAAALATPSPAGSSAPPVPAGSSTPVPAGSSAPSSPASGVPSTPAAATPVASPAVTPSAGGSPAPVPSSEATPTPSPVPYLYRFVPHQPDHVTPDTPQIFAVYLNDKKLRSQGPIDIKVATSPNVVKVISRSGGQVGVIPMVAAGDFEANSKLPKVPFIAQGVTVFLEFVATGPSGTTTSVRVPVQLL